MKNPVFRIIILGSLVLLGYVSCRQSEQQHGYEDMLEDLENDSLVYDSLLAAELGADAYGMKKFVIALLKSGPNRSQDSAEAMKLQRAHLDNIARLANEGKLVLAGPFLDDTDLRGIYIFNVATVEEAHKLTESDPAIQQGRLEMELHPWYGSAGLLKINEIHGRISKESI